MLAACGGTEAPRIGVVASSHPTRGAIIAGDDLRADGLAVEPWVLPAPEPIAADMALAMAEQFAAERTVLGVVGHSNSAASLAASQIYNREGLVQIAPTTTATAYRNAGPWSFRMVPGDEQQARFLVRVAASVLPGAGRVAVVYANDDYGRSFFRELRPLLERAPAFQGLYSEQADTAHLLALAREIVGVQPELLIWLGRPFRLRVVWDSIRSELPAMRVLCGDGCENGIVYENENGSFTGLRFVRFIDPEASDNDRLAAFQARYREETGIPATAEAVLTYDAVYAIGMALRGGANRRDDVREYLLSLGRGRPALQGLSGPIEFDENGDMRRSYLLAEVTAGGVIAVPVDER